MGSLDCSGGFYDHPSEAESVGVTGTNGKTTAFVQVFF